ncbi:Aste57867_9877 [Aphanomyces stellatus]|uniref:Aste57867_9877 protein n=1 Tax=Aphanomyces stellatus TaxID=120398 RepID=A0A485KPE8_9STRA|nr:hypothetical protein As57867_009838 [Aphanomyces stellatus]VFT86756.1 Aste57867_9877 [Aphanomyces stellatus]
MGLQLLTGRDAIVIIHLVCCVCGVGSLSMPYIFSQAGPTYSSVAFVLNCFFNTYATVALSLCFLKLRHLAHIHTYSDLAVHLWGPKGAYIIQATQLTSCFLLPVAFLVLGGATLLPAIFDGAIDVSTTVWILIMAIILLPIIYIRVLHEAYIVLISGAAATILADALATIDAYVSHGRELYEPTDNISVTHVLNTFGAFALAYGAAVVVPQIQRHHPNPENMPRALIWGMLLISAFYVTLGALGYAHFGCASPSNLLLQMSSGSPRRRIAYLFMQVHISVAFAVFMNPFFISCERVLFPNQALLDDEEESQADDAAFQQLETPKDIINEANKPMVGAAVVAITPKDTSTHDNTSATTDKEASTSKYSENARRIVFRTLMVGIQCFLAMLTQSSFSDIADLVGASVMNICSVILPLMLYYKLFKDEMSRTHKVVCWAVIIVSIGLGTYSSIKAIVNIVDNASQYKLFASVAAKKRTEYPYCPAGYMDRKAPWLDSFTM